METFVRTVSYLLKNFKNLDAKAFTAQPAIKTPFPEPNIVITSPSCGPSGSTFDIDHTQDGKDLFPELTWTSPSPETVEYLIVVQDVDVPIPVPITHGIYYSIPAEIMSMGPESVTKEGEGGSLKGGFRHGANFRGTHWSGPKPLKGHGTHRYFFQVIALKEKLDVTKMSPLAKKAELLKEIEGKVVGWGNWIGIAERK